MTKTAIEKMAKWLEQTLSECSNGDYKMALRDCLIKARALAAEQEKPTAPASLVDRLQSMVNSNVHGWISVARLRDVLSRFTPVPDDGGLSVYCDSLEKALEEALYAIPCANCPLYVDKKMCVPNDEKTCMMPRKIHYLGKGILSKSHNKEAK
jgi:hypothetical protein